MIKLILILFLNIIYCQWYTINHGGIERSYFLSIPSTSSLENPSPLIINLHGYGGNATQQLNYSQMNDYALQQNIAVLYPQGINNSWNVFTYWDTNDSDDVSYISELIDIVSTNFHIDLDRIYACGMSNGGYMAYRLACDLSNKIAAFGSVTGNFMININDFNDCAQQNREIPIIHFHGTYDNIVGYYPPSFDGSLTVTESIDYWIDYNDLTNESIQAINNFVYIYTYSKESSNTNFTHYKIYGGGHEWFGNNWGFNTSEVLVDFFLNYNLSDFINSSFQGDLNNDGVINILDIIILVNMILINEYSDIADINYDGIIDILDLILYNNIILGY